MTAAEITTISAAIVAVLGGVGGLLTVMLNILIRLRADTESIKGHVNSEKTASDGRETALKQKVEMMQRIIDEKKQTAVLLAQATAISQTTAAAPKPELAATPKTEHIPASQSTNQ